MPIVTLSDLQAQEFPNPYTTRRTSNSRLGFSSGVDFTNSKQHDRKTLITIFSVLAAVSFISLLFTLSGTFDTIEEHTNHFLNPLFVTYLLQFLTGYALYRHFKFSPSDISLGDLRSLYEALAVYGLIYFLINLIGVVLPTQGPTFWISPLSRAFGIFFAFWIKSFFDGWTYRGFFNVQIISRSLQKHGGLKGYYLGVLYGHLVYTAANVFFLFTIYPPSFIVLAFLLYFISTVYLVFIHHITGNLYVSITMQVLFSIPAALTVDDETARIPLFFCLIVIMFCWKMLPFVRQRNEGAYNAPLQCRCR
ncbi:hypothetical protein GEMRC1_005152 [Eukaryota sp. GEM-RC1]